jgi:hypothetical protein
MLLAWKRVRAITYAGYILGFPGDTPESIRQDIEIIKRELPLDVLEFFCLTPLPGSEDHKVLTQTGVPTDPDMNKYDLEHVVTGHARMSKQEWEAIYREAWNIYYTPEHIRTILRRAARFDVGISHLSGFLAIFAKAVEIEGVHPLQGGVLRRKSRRDRRHGMSIEPAWVFYPAYGREMVSKTVRMVRHWLAIDRIRREVRHDPARHAYTDAALAPVADHGTETLELFTHSQDARDDVARRRRIAEITGGRPRQPQTRAD